MAEPVAIYLHTPFCPSKCGYCDFNSYAMEGDIQPRTVAAILRQIEASPWRGRPAKTIFFGGGTPTHLPASDLSALLRAVTEAHPPIAEIEITTEANPGTVDAEKFEMLRAAGFNRISLGAQSFDDGELLALGRVHAASHIGRAVKAARVAGFKNLNLDLMFALPHQSERVWRENLQRAIDLEPDHLSLYCLTLEPNTAFYKRHLKGELVLPDDDHQAAMFDLTLELAESVGYRQYEISNFAKPGFECAHNLCYWRGEEYAAYGPGGVWRMGMERATHWKHPERFCEAVESGADTNTDRESLDASILSVERVMLGIRLNEGIAQDGLSMAGLTKVTERGWVRAMGDRIALTPLGRRFCTEATLELMP